MLFDTALNKVESGQIVLSQIVEWITHAVSYKRESGEMQDPIPWALGNDSRCSGCVQKIDFM
ncbi:hypothetical protein GCM10007207_07130 [Asaia siamensis]|uniref:Uncharacterized protein n=1 Tax=Asaia siamensis TaxID=110479 RepID=A0ABQ1LGB7_9PROT|nr:hypothetical protein AA0323_0713 [Asaia siamensis NRIC 0323]GGC24436.1 hypothetical protein GCM10007207_07130 [Asaia siamensis]